MRAQPSDSRWISNSEKFLRAAAILGATFALFGAVAICLVGFGAYAPSRVEPKGSADTPILPTRTVSPALPADQDIGTVQPDTNEAPHESIAPDRSSMYSAPAPTLNPTPAPTPAPMLKVSVSDSELLQGDSTDARPKNLDRELPKAVRLNLERERRAAEHKRSRLEEAYQKHAISSDAYKRGMEDYKGVIERYRNQTNAESGTPNGS